MRMFLAGFTPWVGLAVLTDIPTADGGGAGGGPTGGGAPSTGAADPAGPGDAGDAGAEGIDPSATPAAAAEPATEESIEDLLAGDDDPNEALRPADERIKALADRRRKLQRRLAKMAPVYQRMEGRDIDAVLSNARNYEQLIELAQSNPTLARQLLGIDAAPAAAPARAAGDAPPADDAAALGLIDLAKLPFEANSDVNKFFYKLAEDFNSLKKELHATRELAKGADQRLSSEAKTGRTRNWKSAIDSAAGQIPDEGLRDVFTDLMKHAFNAEEQKVTLGQRAFAPEFYVNHYLKKLKVNADTQRRAQDAVRQRGAERTAALPRQQTGSGAPAPVNGNVRIDMAEARRRMLAAR